MSLQDPQPGEQAAIVVTGVTDLQDVVYLDSVTLEESKYEWAEYRGEPRTFYPGQVLVVVWDVWEHDATKNIYMWRPLREDEDGAGT